jgi:hypothetical protein
MAVPRTQQLETVVRAWQCLERSATGRLFGHGSAYDAVVRDVFQSWQCLERSATGRLFRHGSAYDALVRDLFRA